MNTAWLITDVELDGRQVDVRVAGGRFAAIEPAGTMVRTGAEQVLDGKNKAILPGFYNAHTHAAMTLMRGYADDLELFDWLRHHIWPLEAKLTERDVYIGARLAILEMIRSGTVFFADMYWHQTGTLRAAEELGIRVSLGVLSIEGGDGEILPSLRESNAALLASRGKFSDRVQLALAPHAIYTVGERHLRQMAQQSQAEGLPVHIHLAETRKEFDDCRQAHGGLSPVAYLERVGLLNERLVAAHCVTMTDADLRLMAERGAVAVTMPCSNLKLGSGMFRFVDATAAGCRVALGTDGASSNNNLSMLDEMKFAALAAKAESGKVTGGRGGEIFHAATVAGARAFGIDGGLIEVGRVADCMLVALDHPLLVGHDLLSDMVYSADSSVVCDVMIDGRVVMADKVVPGEAEIVAEARACIRDLRRR